MAHGVIGNVLFDSEVVHTVNGDSSVVGLMDGVALNVGLVHGSNHMEMERVSTELESLTDIGKLNVLNATNARLITWGVNHDVGAVFVSVGGFGVTSVHNVSGEETNFGSHLNGIGVEGLDSSEMLADERLGESDHGLGTGGNGSDGALLSGTGVEAGGGNDDLLSNLPVDGFEEGDGGGTNGSGDIKGSPCGGSGNSVHFDLTESDTDHLVSVDGKVGIRNRGVHSDGKLGGVREVLSSSFEVSTLDHDVVSVEGSVMSGVTLVGREDDGSLNDDSVKLGSGVNINEEVLSLGDRDGLSIKRRDVTAPGSGLTVERDVSEDKALGGDGTESVDNNREDGLIGGVGLVGGSASDSGGSHDSTSALTSVNKDSCGAGVDEVLTGEHESVASENRTESGRYGSKFGGLGGVISDGLKISNNSVDGELGNASSGGEVLVSSDNTNKVGLTNSAGAGNSTVVSVLFVGRKGGIVSEVFGVPAFVDILVKSPEVVPSGASVTGSLENEVSNERSAVVQVGDEDLSFVNGTDLLIDEVNSEVATDGGVNEIVKVVLVGELG